MKNYSPKLLITGGMGQLAHALSHHQHANLFDIKAYSRQELDICDQSRITQVIQEFKPDFVINTAAYTAVDKAETERELARNINCLGTKNLAIACQEHNIPLIHISTDYIFDGNKKSPYDENDAANPINFYGETKWLGEEIVRKFCEQHIILRTSGVFSEYGQNFLKTMLRLANEKKKLRIVSDQIACPTYAGDIANTILLIANNFKKTGTYHYTSGSPISWHQFATEIFNQAQLSVEEITAIATSEYITAAKRPLYSVLNCEKISTTFGITQPNWHHGIKSTLQGIS